MATRLAPVVMNLALQTPAACRTLLERFRGIALVTAASAHAPAISHHGQIQPAALRTGLHEQDSPMIQITQFVPEQTDEMLDLAGPVQEPTARRRCRFMFGSTGHDKGNVPTGI